MRTLPPVLAAHLADGVTTLCRCWVLERRDGVRIGFTDHDRDLVLDGVSCLAGSGLEAAETTEQLGFAVGGGDVSGVLSGTQVSDDDIARGLLDDATVRVWLVDWREPGTRLLLGEASIGEVRRRDGAFVAELRGPTHRFAETRGLTYRRACSADLGDGRCRVDLGRAELALVATVADTDGALFITAGTGGDRPAGWFSGGTLTWTSGAQAGTRAAVRAHRRDGDGAAFDLWERAGGTIVPGDGFRVTAGCDKALETCAAKFGNVPNFRGFPHMPGNDAVFRVAKTGGPAPLDGGSLFR